MSTSTYYANVLPAAAGEMNAQFEITGEARQEYADAELALAEAYATLKSAAERLDRAEQHLEYACDDFSRAWKESQSED